MYGVLLSQAEANSSWNLGLKNEEMQFFTAILFSTCIGAYDKKRMEGLISEWKKGFRCT
jgi:hypothetical protein